MLPPLAQDRRVRHETVGIARRLEPRSGVEQEMREKAGIRIVLSAGFCPEVSLARLDARLECRGVRHLDDPQVDSDLAQRALHDLRHGPVDLRVRKADDQRQLEPPATAYANAIGTNSPTGRVEQGARGGGIVIGAANARRVLAQRGGGHDGGTGLRGPGPHVAREALAIRSGSLRLANTGVMSRVESSTIRAEPGAIPVEPAPRRAMRSIVQRTASAVSDVPS